MPDDKVLTPEELTNEVVSIMGRRDRGEIDWREAYRLANQSPNATVTLASAVLALRAALAEATEELESWKATAEELGDRNVNKALSARHEMREADLRKRLAAATQERDEARAQVAAMVKALADCVEAFRLTREYLGDMMLPAEQGWPWFDAMEQANVVLATPLARAALAAQEAPK